MRDGARGEGGTPHPTRHTGASTAHASHPHSTLLAYNARSEVHHVCSVGRTMAAHALSSCDRLRAVPSFALRVAPSAHKRRRGTTTIDRALLTSGVARTREPRREESCRPLWDRSAPTAAWPGLPTRGTTRGSAPLRRSSSSSCPSWRRRRAAAAAAASPSPPSSRRAST